jgi:pimeloyl-ACP methyl ester carboxylesterase
MAATESPVSSADGPATTTKGALFHLSKNPDADETLIFLHGITSCHLEWDMVTKYVPKSYHLLLVDLPAHSNSINVKPFSMSLAATKVAEIIRLHAHKGRAHVVGLSLGGFVAIELAIRFPELVQTLYITGATPFRGVNAFLSRRPLLIYMLLGLFIKCTPLALTKLIWKMMGFDPPPGLVEEQRKNFSYDLVRDGYGGILHTTFATIISLGKTGIRTMVVAGGKQDDTDSVAKMGHLMRENGCAQSNAAVSKTAMHAWNLQFPERFAQSIAAWIENQAQPDGMEELC